MYIHYILMYSEIRKCIFKIIFTEAAPGWGNKQTSDKTQFLYRGEFAEQASDNPPD